MPGQEVGKRTSLPPNCHSQGAYSPYCQPRHPCCFVRLHPCTYSGPRPRETEVGTMGNGTTEHQEAALPLARAVPPNVRLAVAALLVGVAYYVGAQVGFVLHFPGSPIAMLWPPNSLMLAAFLLTPTRWWWALLVGALPAHLAVQLQNGAPLVPMFGLFVTNCGQGLLGAAALRRTFPGRFHLGGLRRVGYFVACAALLAPLVIAFAASALIVGTGWGTDYWDSWRAQFLSNVLTVLTLVPAILGLAA